MSQNFLNLYNMWKRQLMVLFCFLFLKIAVAQIHPYYETIDLDLSGDQLKFQLSDLIINTHQNQIPYTSNLTPDTWDVIKASDSYIQDTTKVSLIYGYDDEDNNYVSDLSRDKSLSCHGNNCEGLWNREHIYPRSLSNPEMITNSPGPGTDVHNLRSCDYTMNINRSNLIFCSSNGTSGLTANNCWYPGDEWIGDIARIIMYMYLRYSSQCSPLNVGNGSAEYSPNHDMLDLFLEWNALDPVSDFEKSRNEEIFNYQGNRNPFIDNPFLATLIWGGPDAENSWLGLSFEDTHFEKEFSLQFSLKNSLLEVNTNKGQISMLLYDISGKLVFKMKGTILDLKGLTNGLYLLEIKNENQSIHFKKVFVH